MSHKFIESIKHSYAISRIRKYGFWFVDIPRTSSTSIKHELGRKFGITYKKYWVRGRRMYLRGIFEDHLSAEEMKTILGDELWEEIFTFSMVRNPWDRAYSLYNYMIGGIGPGEPLPGFREHLLNLKEEFISGKFRRPLIKNSCFHYLCEGDEIIVDRVIKYENREEELKEISEIIGCNISPTVHHGKTREGSGYREHYDEETKKIIELVYAKDIEQFGYSFD